VKIAVFTNTYLPLVNGVANVIEAYRKSLSSLGHEVYIFTARPSDEQRDVANRVFRFPSVEAPNLDYHLAMPFSLPVMRALQRTHFDIVHTHHPLWVGVWGMWYANWAKLPLITTIHTEYQVFADAVPLPGVMVEEYLTKRVAKYCNKCDLITTPVESMRSKLSSAGVTRPIELLPNPADLSPFGSPDAQTARSRVGFGPEHTVVGFVGRLSPEKNLECVLRAVKIVMDQHPQCRLLLVGDGAARSSLVKMAADLGIADRTHFTGESPHKQIPQWQAAIDIFVTASLSETQPLAYTEAMAVGTPVVALKAPGAEDMFQHMHNGMLTDPHAGPEGLASAVCALIRDPKLRARLGRQAKEWVQRYEITAATERLLGLYDGVLTAHRQVNQQA
jgi:1,2-diacylglycerol 3-alpha-glucosyltransferase